MSNAFASIGQFTSIYNGTRAVVVIAAFYATGLPLVMEWDQ